MSESTHDEAHAHDGAHGSEAAHGSAAAHDYDDEGGYYVHSHISSTKFYVAIFATLIFLTLVTVGISRIHLGSLNLAVAVVIASIKASLVVLFFMHLKYDRKFNGLIFICTLMFIGVFFAYTVNDTNHRGEVDESQGTYIDRSSGKEAPGGLTLPPKPMGSSNTAVEGAQKVEDHKEEHH